LNFLNISNITFFSVWYPYKKGDITDIEKVQIVFDYTADLAGTGDRSEYISSY